MNYLTIICTLFSCPCCCSCCLLPFCMYPRLFMCAPVCIPKKEWNDSTTFLINFWFGLLVKIECSLFVRRQSVANAESPPMGLVAGWRVRCTTNICVYFVQPNDLVDSNRWSVWFSPRKYVRTSVPIVLDGERMMLKWRGKVRGVCGWKYRRNVRPIQLNPKTNTRVCLEFLEGQIFVTCGTFSMFGPRSICSVLARYCTSSRLSPSSIRGYKPT